MLCFTKLYFIMPLKSTYTTINSDHNSIKNIMFYALYGILHFDIERFPIALLTRKLLKLFICIIVSLY